MCLITIGKKLKCHADIHHGHAEAYCSSCNSLLCHECCEKHFTSHLVLPFSELAAYFAKTMEPSLNHAKTHAGHASKLYHNNMEQEQKKLEASYAQTMERGRVCCCTFSPIIGLFWISASNCSKWRGKFSNQCQKLVWTATSCNDDPSQCHQKYCWFIQPLQPCQCRTTQFECWGSITNI